MFGQRQPSIVTLFRSHGHNNAVQSEKVSLVKVERPLLKMLQIISWALPAG